MAAMVTAWRTRGVHHVRQWLSWSPPGVHEVYTMQDNGCHGHRLAYTRCTPCKTMVAMVTAWRTRGVHHARQMLPWSPPGVHEVYTMQDKWCNGHRLAYTRCHHARQMVQWSPPGVHEVYTMQDKCCHGHRLAYTRCTPCKTNGAMVTAWRRRGVTMQDKCCHGHRLAYFT